MNQTDKKKDLGLQKSTPKVRKEHVIPMVIGFTVGIVSQYAALYNASRKTTLFCKSHQLICYGGNHTKSLVNDVKNAISPAFIISLTLAFNTIGPVIIMLIKHRSSICQPNNNNLEKNTLLPTNRQITRDIAFNEQKKLTACFFVTLITLNAFCFCFMSLFIQNSICRPDDSNTCPNAWFNNTAPHDIDDVLAFSKKEQKESILVGGLTTLGMSAVVGIFLFIHHVRSKRQADIKQQTSSSTQMSHYGAL